ncbi:MAG: hypothetical protein UHD64_00615 [Bacteroidales bacterium]|nr:hypothetical protein [Bacteroidales bacterium]
MAKYNTFVVYNCKGRKNLLVTSSARKAKGELHIGIKIEVWNENTFIENIYFKTRKNLNKYVSEEKEYIAMKQVKAEKRNKRRKGYGL